MTGRRLRKLIAAVILVGAIVAGAVAWWARHVAPRRFRLEHVIVQLPRRHRHLSGLTIAFVTDTHVGPHFAASDLEPIVAHLEAIQPDLVLFGGDYICESPRFMAKTAPVLGRMAATSRNCALAVLGNHDISNLVHRVAPPIEEQGIRVLRNEAACVDTDRGPLWIAGIDEALLGKPDLERAFQQVPPDAAAICLWHEPDKAAAAAPYGPFLQLSGHTHGGQVRVPGIGPLSTPSLGKKFVRGRYQIGDMELYVSTGLGIYRPPVRFNCPPELTIIRLID